MITFFRKLLIRVGKIIPFVFAFIVMVSHIETAYAVLNDNIILDLEGYYTYDVPISNYIGNIVYIDWFDVLIVWILCVALELCFRAFRCAYLITLNLPFRWLTEHVYLDWWIVVGIAGFMALAGLYCVYGGFKMIPKQKKEF